MGLNWGAFGDGLINLAKPYIQEEIQATQDQRRSDLAVSQAQKLEQIKEQMAEERRSRIGEKMKTETERLHGERFGDDARFKSYLQEQGMTEDELGKMGFTKQQIIESLKQGGNYDANEIDKARVRADAASNLGYKDEETHARGLLNSAISEKRYADNDAYQKKRNELADKKEEQRHSEAMRRLEIAAAKAGGNSNFQFDADKQEKSAHALVGLSPTEVKLYHDESKMMPEEKRAQVAAKLAQAEVLLTAAARKQVPVDVIFRAYMAKKAEKAGEQKEPAPAPAAEAPSAPKAPGMIASNFNSVGYRDINSTIAGAKRGDKKALEYLLELEPNELTIGQREQIKNIK